MATLTPSETIAEMNILIDRSNQIRNQVAELAVRYIVNYMRENGLTKLGVDGDSEHPDWALDEFDSPIDDEDLCQAVGWLPASLVHRAGATSRREQVTLDGLLAALELGIEL